MLFPDLLFPLALAIFLIATFIAMGLLSCWAATSHRHWFLRTAVVFALLSPLLFAHALEPFATLLLHAATVAVGVAICRRSTDRDSSNQRSEQRAKTSFRFSLTTIMLAIGVTAAILALLIRMPELNWNAWQTMLLVGTCTGLCVLIAFCGTHARYRWWIRVPAVLVASLLVAVPLLFLDFLIPSMTSWIGWPPEDLGSFVFGIFNDVQSTWLWFVVCPAISIAVFIFLTVYRVSFARRKEGSSQSVAIPSNTSRLASWSAVTLFVAILSVPAFGLWVLLRPPEFIQPQTSDRENYENVVALSRAIERSKFRTIEINWDTLTKKSLESPIADIEQEFEQLHAAVRQSTQVPLDYQFDDLSTDTFGNFRTVARALCAKGRLAMLNGQSDDACNSFLDTIRFGFAVRDKGLLIDGLVGIACANLGMTMLYEHRESYSSGQCQIAARDLLSISDKSESFQRINTRDRGWVQSVYGWHGRIQQSLEDMVDGDEHGIFGNMLHVFGKEQAEMRLLAIELSLRAYYLDQGRWPDSLSQLVPEFLPRVPADPFDASLGPLRYTRSSDQYSLYSVGPDGIDDGGQWPADRLEIFEHGDLMLDVSFPDDNVGP